MSKTTLPEIWQSVKFQDIVREAQPGFASGQRDPEGVIQLRMNNVDTLGNFKWAEFIRVPTSDAALQKYRLEPDDIVFNNTNSTELVGKSALFTGFDEPIVFSNHFTRIRTKPELANAGFVTHWLISQWQAKTFERICNRWIGQSAVKNDKLFSLEIPLPPLAEQRRIAARLNEQMAAVAEARRAAEAQLRAARELPAAYLRSIFSPANELIPKNWRMVKLGDICEINPHRPVINRIDASTTTFVPMSAVDEADGVIARPEQRPYSEVKKGYTYFIEGDVLFAKITPCMENGKQAIAHCLMEGIGFGSTEFHVIRPNEHITAEWIWYFLRQPSIRQAATYYFTGAVGQQRVPDSFLKSLDILLPPVAEQQHFASEMEGQMKEVVKMRRAIETQLTEINRLPAALLHQAFSGGLL